MKPDWCEECGRCGDVEAHHYFGCSKECALLVQWLGKPCHIEADKVLRRAAKQK